jgi:hypothetical protein
VARASPGGSCGCYSLFGTKALRTRGRGAGIHSTTRVNGFLDMQSEDIHTADQKPKALRCAGWWLVLVAGATRWSWHTASSLSRTAVCDAAGTPPATPPRYSPAASFRGGPMELAPCYCQRRSLPLTAVCDTAAGTPPAAPPRYTQPRPFFRGGPMELTYCQLPAISPRITATQ